MWRVACWVCNQIFSEVNPSNNLRLPTRSSWHRPKRQRGLVSGHIQAGGRTAESIAFCVNRIQCKRRIDQAKDIMNPKKIENIAKNDKKFTAMNVKINIPLDTQECKCITEVETIIAIVTLIHRDIIYPLAIIYNVWVAIITLYVGIISQIICLQMATYKSLLNSGGPLIPFFRGCCSTTNGNRKEIMKHGLFHAFHAHLSTVLVNSYYHGYYIYFLEIVCYSQKCKIYCLVFSDISVWVDPKIHTTACFMIMYTNCKYF